MDNVRILKGYSKEEQAELEEVKDTGNLGEFLHNITGYPEDTNCGYVWDSYHKASSREQIYIIEDILDFYTGKAKFPEQKYYVHLIKDDWYSYLNITSNGVAELGNDIDSRGWKTKFTRDEVVAIDPKLVSFMEDVEDNE